MRRSLVTICCLLLAMNIFAQPGIAEFGQVQKDLNADFFSIADLSLVLATLLGLNGGIKIYYNWQMGKDRIDSDVAAWLFSAFFMVLASAILKAMFGI